MEETKTLQMTFLNEANGRVTISVADPKDDLTENEVETAMNNIIMANVISSNGGDLVEIVSARIITRQVEDILVV
ncbi:MAG: DUF2922 domain-containing protein [Clostridia bacterium]|nr:DUF2922 domain-containing protein [Clostridia bacterium]